MQLTQVTQYLPSGCIPHVSISRNQPNFNGIFKVPVAQIPELMKYLADADPASDDYAGEHVLLRVSGWKKTAKSGNNYLSLKMTPDQSMLQSSQAKADTVINPDVVKNEEDMF